MGTRLFDLNIEEVLENWEVHHAIRELIANALDEHVLSHTAEPRIFRADDAWHVQDYGRGLRIQHFTQNENPEKLRAEGGVIGKFGVGLKDALATLHRHVIDVTIKSRFGTYRLQASAKSGFAGITTLHVQYDDSSAGTEGTDIVLRGVQDADIDHARSLFLRFSNDRPIETTPYGDVLAKAGDGARVYINGVFANDEPNFLFSYNITSLTAAMRKRLNRERLNVGRSTYTERVVAILKQSDSQEVSDALVAEAFKAKGDQHDEMQWGDVAQLALNRLSERKEVSFVTESQLQTHPDIVDNMRRDGYEVVVVGETQQDRLERQAELGGPVLRTFGAYVQEYNASFEYRFVEPAQLNKAERAVLDTTPELMRLVGVPQSRAPRVRVSETIRVTLDNTGGVWDAGLGSIVIKRDHLADTALYAATLLHEVGHAMSNTVDATREFEHVLTAYLGLTGTAAIDR